MKIIHCSDLHLGKRPSGRKHFADTRYEDFFAAFQRLIDCLLKEELDLLLLAGDFFDKREINASILEKTEALLRRLREEKPKLRILVIEGNHDVIQQEESSWLKYLENQGYFEVFSYKKDFLEGRVIEIEDVKIYPVGYPGFMVDKALEDLAERLDPKEKNIVMVHTGISGSEASLPGLVSTKILDLFKDKVIYMAGGHIHSYNCYPKEKPFFFVPGSLEYTNIMNERSQDKGVIAFDTETREHHFISLPPRKRIKAPVFSYEVEIEEEFRDYLKGLELEGEELLIIPVDNRRRDYINADRLEEIAVEEGALKAYLDIKSAFKEGTTELSDEGLPLQEVEKELILDWKALQDMKSFAEGFSTLKHLQEEEKEEEFLQHLDQILEEDEQCS